MQILSDLMRGLGRLLLCLLVFVAIPWAIIVGACMGLRWLAVTSASWDPTPDTLRVLYWVFFGMLVACAAGAGWVRGVRSGRRLGASEQRQAIWNGEANR